jgi:hypothetical protein
MLTLNCMRPFSSHPSRSAWHGIHGRKIDFAAHPIHPAGQLVVAHDPPNQRPSWARHGTRGFYLAPALTHYRSHIIFIPSTLDTRISNQIDLFPDPLFSFEDPTILVSRPHFLPSVPHVRRHRSCVPVVSRSRPGPLHGHWSRPAHFPPTLYRQFGAPRSPHSPRLAPNPILHHPHRCRGIPHRPRSRTMACRAPCPADADSRASIDSHSAAASARATSGRPSLASIASYSAAAPARATWGRHPPS